MARNFRLLDAKDLSIGQTLIRLVYGHSGVRAIRYTIKTIAALTIQLEHLDA